MSIDPSLSLAAGVELLSKRPQRLEGAAILSWGETGGSMCRSKFPLRLFEAWVAAAKYQELFPRYCGAFEKAGFRSGELRRKQMEHFASIWLSGVRPDSVVVDVAASSSPLGDILTQLHYTKQVWRQDLKFKTNRDTFTLGGDARDIELANESVDVVMLHNSWEHFEDDSDRLFLHEAFRILKPGGVLCIVPLDFALERWVETDPSVWHSKYKGVIESPPEISTGCPVFLNDQLKQRYQQYIDPATLHGYFNELPGFCPALHYFADYKAVDCRENGTRKEYCTFQKKYVTNEC